MSVSNTFMRLGVLSALVGMMVGMWMGANNDFTLTGLHAHINLLGFTSMMLFGLFYRFHPEIAEGRLAAGHFILWVLGFLVLMPSLGLMLLGRPFSLPLMIGSQVALVLSMVLFAVVIFIATQKKPVAA